MSQSANSVHRVFSKLQVVEDEAGVERILNRLSTPHAATVLSFLNAHAVNLAAKQAEFAANLAASDLLLRDGKGVEIAQRFFGLAPGLNLNGTDFIPRIIARYQKRRVALFGTREPYLSRAAQVLESRYGVEVVAQVDGFRSMSEYVSSFHTSRPDLVVLAMGMPKQEAVSMALRASSQVPCLLVNGGAILDYVSGRVPRAPLWMRQRGWEWLFRLAVEPRRLFKRYVVGNFLFLARVLSAAVSWRLWGRDFPSQTLGRMDK